MANVQSVERSLLILEVLSKNPRGLGITDLAHQLHLAKSTTHRLLTTLMDKGFVVQSKETEGYSLGIKIVELSSSILDNLNIRTVAKSELEALCNKTNEVVHLCLHENGEVVYIDKFESNQTIRMHSRVGKRGMMHSTGVGKILLSGMTDEEVRAILHAKGMLANTSHTITDEETLFRRLEKVNLNGYEIDDIENEEGIRCIAGPIYDYSGQIIATFSISGPDTRMTVDRVHSNLTNLVLDTSRAISRKMGYMGK